MAYLNDDAVEELLNHAGAVDLLVTHQGPAAAQGEGGSETLDLLLDGRAARVWCHGHTVRNREVARWGSTTVVPLGHVAFSIAPGATDLLGRDGWARVVLSGSEAVAVREAPARLREFRRGRWVRRDDGLLICPALEHLAHRFRDWRAQAERRPGQ